MGACVFVGCLLLFILASSAVTAERLPIVGGDSGSWGAVLNEFLNVSHNESGELRNGSVSGLQIVNGTITDADISDTTNLTALYFIGDGSRLTNVNGSGVYVPYTGAMNNLDLGANNFLINNSVFFVNATSGNVGIGTANPNHKLQIMFDNGHYFEFFDDGDIYMRSDGADFRFGRGGVAYSIVAVGENKFYPAVASYQTDLGTSSYKWRNLYVGNNTYLDGDVHVNSSILSPTGTLTLGGTGGTNNEDLTFDFETSANTIGISSTTVANQIVLGDDFGLGFGVGLDSRLIWETTGNDNLQLGLAVGQTDRSGYFSIMEKADLGNANRSPSSTSADPVLRVYSSDATEANDYIEMYHDQSKGIIASGGQILDFKTDGGQYNALRIYGDSNTGFMYLKANDNVGYLFVTDSGKDENLIAISDNGGNQITVTNYGNRNSDHDHAVQTDPTLFIHSDTNPDDDNTEWGSLAYVNATDSFDLDVGKGDLKILPSATGDVELFGGTDVANDSDGKSFYVHRKAEEGDNYLRFFVSQWREPELEMDGISVFRKEDAKISFARGNTSVQFFKYSGDTDPVFQQNGYITAGSDNKYIQWQVNDATDKFELTREDANITAFDIQMPLITDGITMSDTLTLQNGETITNAIDGKITFGGVGGTYNESMYIQLDAYTNEVHFGSGSGANFYFDDALGFKDDTAMKWGNNEDTVLIWETEGNDNLQLGTAVGDAAYSGYISIMERADMSNANRSPTSTSADPVLRVYSADASEANDYIEMYHDQTAGVIATDGLILDSAGNIKLDSHDSIFYFLKDGGDTFMIYPSTAHDETRFGLTDAAGNLLIITNHDYRHIDHDHALQTDPTLYIHSDTDPDDDNTEWGSLAYVNATDSFDIDLGKGDLKLLPSATGDVSLFEDTDVANDSDGKSLVIHRKAEEGDRYMRFYIDDTNNHFISPSDTTSSSIRFGTPDDYIAFVPNDGSKSQLFTHGYTRPLEIKSGDLTLGDASDVGRNPWVRMRGYITAGTASKYISWQVNDDTDNFELTREDANITAFDIQMPLEVSGTFNSTSNGGSLVVDSDGNIKIGI